jgi:hypothetical protein
VTTSNDFINGPLNDYYRQQLFQDYANIPNAIALAQLPDYTPFYIRSGGPRLQAQLANPPYPGFQESLKLDAPLAVQIETRPGFFPFSKFSSPPLAISAARDAASESGFNDVLKRLMIVPNCHVKRLTTRTYTLATGAAVQEVIGIDVNDGTTDRPIDLTSPIAGNPNRRPMVILAMGAIESARMALFSVGNVPNANQIGANLMVHVRKNAGFRAPLPAGLVLRDLEVSALLVRCQTVLNGTPVHFHFQITVSALPAQSGAIQADLLLFQNVPDLDNIRRLGEMVPGEVDVFIRGVGEMLPNVQNNTVTLPLQPPDNDEYNVPRAFVTINRGPEDTQLQAQMDAVIQHLAQKIFNAAGPVPITLDGLGTTFHESGTLRMGDNPTLSVVNADGQFHYVTNLYVGDAAVLPTCGSANPVMNGIALRRRLAKRLVPEGDGIGNPQSGRPIRPFFQPAMPTQAPNPGTVMDLFDGQTLANWRMAGRGTFHIIDGALQSVPSFDLGLLWCTIPMPENYRLELEFFIRTFQTNSGVFIRFKNPESTGDYNPAWSAVFSGFEVQIDNTGAPDGRPEHRTGAVYGVNYATTPGDFVNPQDAQVLAWNQYRIEVQGNQITVNLNGVPTAQYTNTDLNRGQFTANEPTFVGLQAYSNYAFTTAFRKIRVTVL